MQIPIVLFREIEKQIEVKRLRKLSIERLGFLKEQDFKEIPSDAIGALKVYYYAENWNGVDDSLYLAFFDKDFKVLEDNQIPFLRHLPLEEIKEEHLCCFSIEDLGSWLFDSFRIGFDNNFNEDDVKVDCYEILWTRKDLGMLWTSKYNNLEVFF